MKLNKSHKKMIKICQNASDKAIEELFNNNMPIFYIEEGCLKRKWKNEQEEILKNLNLPEMKKLKTILKEINK